MDALVSTNPLTKWLFISRRRWRVLFQWFLWILILHTIVGPSTLVKLINFNPSLHYFFAKLTRFSKDPNSLGITKMVSTKIFPLMKCVYILDLIMELVFISTCPASWSPITSPLAASISRHFLGIFDLMKTSCFEHIIYSTPPMWDLHHPPRFPNSCWQQMVLYHHFQASNICPWCAPYQNSIHISLHRIISYVNDHI